MMVENNSFDLWKNDSFFSAAEEVQESTDRMESAYRLWIRERRERLNREDLDELCRELQTALGTAKWQLEEFERAVRLSYSHRCNDNASARHRQFIAAIENQILHVEAALRESFSEEGKQPLQWINLDEEERDDLAMFLSGNSPTFSSVKDECNRSRSPVNNSHLKNSHQRRDARLNFNVISPGQNCDELEVLKDAGSINKNSECVIEVKDESPGTSNDIICKADRGIGARRTCSSPKFSALKIVIADEGGGNNKVTQSVEATPKEKGFKPVFWKQSCVENPQARGVVNVFNQLFVGVQRKRQNTVLLPFNRSVRLMLVLMLTVFLVVPFVLYST
ncbi:uncharacterized protein LOC123194805 isoform X3 [Mangifera indica]|uniref:uncharacterized protein LOC123194805 isoform X3 n=1 Tax=Mangifera indica TaxID=29780 RepID=UPI001CFA36C4|nr:uncharacterized protein LOC123194805 isoform X3 [Mangifera indica]